VQFADSITPELYRVLDSAGYHRGFRDSVGVTVQPELHVRKLTGVEAKAEVYEADLSLTLHKHMDGRPGGFPMPENLFLEFTTIRDAPKWALLIDQGYPFTIVSESNHNDLPLDVQVGIRNTFSTRAEFGDWAAFKRAKLAAFEQGGSRNAKPATD
jgi:hypothetical protein